MGTIERINTETGEIESKPSGVEGLWTPFAPKVNDDADEKDDNEEGDND